MASKGYETCEYGTRCFCYIFGYSICGTRLLRRYTIKTQTNRNKTLFESMYTVKVIQHISINRQKRQIRLSPIFSGSISAHLAPLTYYPILRIHIDSD